MYSIVEGLGWWWLVCLMQGVCPMRVSQVCYGASYVNVTQAQQEKVFCSGKKFGLSNIFFDIVELN